MEINIINFQDKFEKDFYNLNIEWLEYFFQVEDYDYEVLSNSKKYIINNGGKIFCWLYLTKIAFKFKNEEFSAILKLLRT